MQLTSEQTEPHADISILTELWEVAIPAPLYTLFDYKIPINDNQRLQAGMRVRVPFGKQSKIGYLVQSIASSIHGDKLKQAECVLDETPLWGEPLWQCMLWASRYYLYPLGEICESGLPKAVRDGKPAPKNLPSSSSVPETPWAIQPSTIQLNQEQHAAVEALTAPSGFRVSLLQGVTGSGKTEVYLHTLAKVLENGGQALVLIPEIALSGQLTAAFAARFSHVTCYHSQRTDKERYAVWSGCRDGTIRLVIGTRSSLFLPFHNLSMIIVDEEHDTLYKQQDGFKYGARDLATKRAQLEGCPIVLGTATD
ncbi:MAG: DEAD/DEAH box helicase, partial [Pseudomonadota bacterium]